jgi:hypothetical protein
VVARYLQSNRYRIQASSAVSDIVTDLSGTILFIVFRYGTTRIFDSLIGPSKPNRIYDTVGDGRCQSRALSYCLSGTEDNHDRVRDFIAAFMLADPNNVCSDYMGGKVGFVVFIF